ncbi:MAG: pyridoxamine 5'-phosphate oxidase family protein [Bryobacteraceae bacterium]
MSLDNIEGPDTLRQHYAPPLERAVLKSLRKLDQHCRLFIELSPFLCIGTQSDGSADVAPRGDKPGFVHILDDKTLAIPDWPGNNRLDSLTNILSNPHVGLLFLVPGVDETLRVNGTAVIAANPELLARWDVNGKHPKSVLLVTVTEAFLHCGKALIRSKLWQDDYKVERTSLPSYGKMLKDQIEVCDTAEEIERSVADAYKTRLY